MIRVLLALVALDFALSAPEAAAEGGWTYLTLIGDLAVIATVASSHERWGPRAGAGLWTLLFVYQCVRLGSTLAMGEEGLMYDLAQLAHHTWVLVRDMVGNWVFAVAGGTIVFTALLAWISLVLLEGVGTALRAERRALAVLWSAVLLGTAVRGAPVSWIVPKLVANISASARAWGEAEGLVLLAASRDPGPVTTGDRPDLHIYVIESYGALLFRNPEQAREFRPSLRGFREQLVEDGWHVATGFSTAPVSGGRSWIADASVLLGVPVAHESTFQHIIAGADELMHLPAWLRREGWHTVLSRPKDRERPGVFLANHYAFDETVFFADLQYTGPEFGWGWVPDQYTLGWLRDEVLPRQTGPTFLFVHLASAHIPWWEPPPVAEDWRSFNSMDNFGTPGEIDMDLEQQVGFTTHRFRRGDRGLGPVLRRHIAIGDPTSRYRDVVEYDLDVIGTHLEALDPSRPTVVLIMGDHQPPGIAPRLDFDVPVHVIATDEKLLAPFIARGFQRGIWPERGTEATLAHQDLYPLLSKVLGAER